MRRRQPDIISDLARMANGAASAFGDLRSELQTVMTSHHERRQASSGQVSAEDFEAALARIDALAARLAILEAQSEKKPAKPARKSGPAKARATRQKKADSAK